MNLEFFDSLYADPIFCAEIGRVVLAAGTLETQLQVLLELHDLSVVDKSATLGRLTATLRKHHLLSYNHEMVLRDFTAKRNYLTHSLYALFAGRLEETLLERDELVPDDIDLFQFRAKQLAIDLRNFARNVECTVAEVRASGQRLRQLP